MSEDSDRTLAVRAHPTYRQAMPDRSAEGQLVCACVTYTIHTGTGVEYDVDHSSCPIHADDDEGRP